MTTDSTKESEGTMKPTKYRYRHTVTIKEKHEHVIDLESSDGRVFGVTHDGFERDYAPVTQDATDMTIEEILKAVDDARKELMNHDNSRMHRIGKCNLALLKITQTAIKHSAEEITERCAEYIRSLPTTESKEQQG